MSKQLLVIVCLFITQLLSAKTIFVNQNTSGSQNGSSWQDAFVFIDDALNDWNNDDTIWVASGQYSPKDSLTTSTFSLPSGCVLLGGFAGTESLAKNRNHLKNPTILSGDINDINYDNDNIRTIVSVSKAAIGTAIDGFIIQNGYNYYVAGGIQRGGAAIRIIDSYLKIENCHFRNNYAHMRGGALYQETGSKRVELINCQFENNSSGNDVNSTGGAIFTTSATWQITDCIFDLNQARSGGAITAYEARLYIDRTIFSGNEANRTNGGAIYDFGDTEFNIYNSLFVGNISDENCPAIFSSAVFNTRFNEIINCTFAHNLAKPSSGTYTVRANNDTRIYNSIFFGNQATLDLFYLSPTFEPDVQNCLIEDGISFGLNNIKGDPDFKNSAELKDVPFSFKDYNYNLKRNSSCFETGNTGLLDKDYILDLNKNNRTIYVNTDIGAYEADFDLVFLTIETSPKQADTFSNKGYLARDTTLLLYADTSACFAFENWTSNGIEISKNPILKITLDKDTTIKANFTQNQIKITANSANEKHGTTTGSGTFNCIDNDIITVTATPKDCYSFTNWTENGKVVSTNKTYNFELSGMRELVANFKFETYIFDLSVLPQGTGTINGPIKADCDDEVELIALPNPGYLFEKWTENGQTISTDSAFNFTAKENLFLTAHFLKNTSVSEVENLEINLFPNPTNGQLTITSSNGQLDVSSILVFNSTGILSEKIELNGSPINGLNIDLSHLAKGFYFVQLNTTEFEILKKITIVD